MKKLLIRTAVFAGLLGGTLFSIFTVVTTLIYDNPLSGEVKPLDYFIYLITIIFTLYYFRFYRNGGFLSFWQGVSLSIITSTVTLIFSLIFLWVLFSIQTDIIDNFAKIAIENFENPERKKAFLKDMKKNNLDGEKMYKQTLVNLKKRDWLAFLIKMEIIFKTIGSLFITFFASALMRKNRYVFEEPNNNNESQKKQRKSTRGKNSH